MSAENKQATKYITINNCKIPFTDEKNVLSIIRKIGIDLPTFCYHSELSTYGACRMCVVEDDRGRVFASCSEVSRDGMVIYTNTPKLQHHRKMADTDCVGCGQCRVVCPTGAITIKSNVHAVWEVVSDKTKRVVVQIAPAVRVAIGDSFGLPRGENAIGKLVAALHRMGFDEIYEPVDEQETIVVSIMPCTAKKNEIVRPEHFTDGVQNVEQPHGGSGGDQFYRRAWN